MLKLEKLTLKTTLLIIMKLLKLTKLPLLCMLLKLKDFSIYTLLGFQDVKKNKTLMMPLPPLIKVI
jgi:hypothetical protein